MWNNLGTGEMGWSKGEQQGRRRHTGIKPEGYTDTEWRKYRDRSRLETCVVYTVNDVDGRGEVTSVKEASTSESKSLPPGEYYRKIQTQRTRRVLIHMVEHAI